MHREQVIDALWPELALDEAAPRLHKAAHFARKAAGDDTIVLRDESVALFPDQSVVIDVALFDAAAVSPLDQLGMIPLLTLIAIYAPPSHRATWFALMASLMNLALTAGALGTKYLNLIFHVDRGSYANLPALVVTAYVVSLVLPLAAIVAFGRRVR